VKSCPNCGNQVHEEAGGCPECGARWHDDGSYAGVPVRTPALEPVGQPQYGATSPYGGFGPEGVVDPLDYAGFKIRVGARLIDLAVIYALALVTGFFGAIVLVVAVTLAGAKQLRIFEKSAGTIAVTQ
jgi:hypothetical protein